MSYIEENEDSLITLINQYKKEPPKESSADFKRLVKSASKHLKKENIAFIFTLQQFEALEKYFPNKVLKHHKTCCGLAVTIEGGIK